MTLAYRDAPRRGEHPHPPPPADPLTLRMAQTMAEMAANGAGPNFADMISHGFTAAEIAECGDAARHLATSMQSRPGKAHPAIADAATINAMARKAAAGVFTDPPRVPFAHFTDEARGAWEAFCFSLSAMRIDRWAGQETRVSSRLNLFVEAAGFDERTRVAMHRAVFDTGRPA